MEEGQTAKEAGDRQRQIAADFSFKIRLKTWFRPTEADKGGDAGAR